MHLTGRRSLLDEVLIALHVRPRRRPTKAELMRMAPDEFLAFIDKTGLGARITASLRNDENGAP